LGKSKAPPCPVETGPTSQTDEEWLEGLQQDFAYREIGVRLEHAKMIRWCEVNKKKPSRRRFINWLNRAEKPMNVPAPEPEPDPNDPKTKIRQKIKKYQDDIQFNRDFNGSPEIIEKRKHQIAELEAQL